MQRFRFAGQCTLVLVCLGWLAWFYPFDDFLDRSGTPLGGDYVMLYVAGQVVAEGQSAALYNDAANQQRTSRLFPQMNSLESWPYRYPPTVAAVMAPLSRLPFGWSYATFLILQLSLLMISLKWLLRSCPLFAAHRGWLWAVVGSPLVLENFIGGQSSLLAVACVVGCVVWLGQGRPALAGICLAVALYKPNVAALFVLAALIAHPRLLLGFVPTVAVGFGLAWWSTGAGVLSQYLHLATHLASGEWSLETPYWKVHGLAPLFQAMWPEHGRLLCTASGIAACLLVGWNWRRGQLDNVSASSLLLCLNALLNPYVPIYDLVLLEVALIFGCQGLSGRLSPAVGKMLFLSAAGLLFMGPHLSQALARSLQWQLFPLVLLAWLAWVAWTMTRATGKAEQPLLVQAS